MASYDEFIAQLKSNENDVQAQKAAIIIAHLQNIVRDYNSDDSIFDDEKTLDPPESTFESALNAAVITEVVLDTVPNVIGALAEAGVEMLEISGSAVGAMAEGIAEGVGSVLEGVADGISSLLDW